MGPRLARRGMAISGARKSTGLKCFNGSTARSPWYERRGERRKSLNAICFNGSTARSPWYGDETRDQVDLAVIASMGPRLARRGMVHHARRSIDAAWRFNGSTARSPWYRPTLLGSRDS